MTQTERENHFKINNGGKVLTDDLIDLAAGTIARLVSVCTKGGAKLTVRANAYEIEAVWTPSRDNAGQLE